MLNRIVNEGQYNKVMASIEETLRKATDKGGFHFLSAKEKEQLIHFSFMVSKYEDEVLKIMPLATAAE